jgi:FAD:protein FMN transferase
MLAVKTLRNDSNIFRHDAWLMGNQFEISVVGNNSVQAGEQINAAIAEINRVERLLSGLTDNSQVNEINRNAGIKPVKVDAEIFRLIDRALQISELTHGAYDITYSTDKSSSHNNYQSVILDPVNVTVFLSAQNIRISLASLSKGYAADRAKYALQLAGVSSGVINAGGDMLTWGAQPNHEPWTIATADPELQNHPYANTAISNMCISTAIDADKQAAANTKQPINAKNGFPVSSIMSVSVISPTAELSGALTAPVMAMGVNASLYLVNKLNQISCIIVDDHNRVYASNGIK